MVTDNNKVFTPLKGVLQRVRLCVIITLEIL
jgi:hypothetical protein